MCVPELSALNVQWEHWLCNIVHMHYAHGSFGKCLACVLSYIGKIKKRKYNLKPISFTDSFKI